MKQKIGRMLAALYVISIPAWAASEMHAPVAAPEVAVGDSWTYQYTDVWKHQPGNVNRIDVTGIDADGFLVDVRRAAGNALVARQRYSREFNPIDRGKMHFAPSFGRYAFPLEPGKEWTTNSTAENQDAGKRWRYQVNGKAVGWETVKVAAGEFDAIKVEAVAYYTIDMVNSRSGSGRSKETVWYAPSVKNFVKMEYEDTDGAGRTFNRDEWELTAFVKK